MGDAFKGLTIRIGADVRPLSSALNSIQHSAGQAQSHINKLTRALDGIGGAHVSAASARISLMDDKIMLAARSARTLKTALDQAPESIRRATSDSRLFYAEQQKARSAVRGVNSELQTVYDALAKIMASNTKGLKFEDARKEVKKLAKQIDEAGDSGKKARHELQQLGMSLKNSDMLPGTAQGQNLKNSRAQIDVIRLLRAEHEKLEAVQKRANEVADYGENRAKLAAYEAEMRQAIETQVRFRAEQQRMAANPAVAQATSQIRAMDAATNAAAASASRVREAYNKMPTSISAIRSKMAAAESESTAWEAKLSAIHQKLRAIEGTPGFDRVKASSKDVYADVAKLETKLTGVNQELVETKAKLESLEAEMADAAKFSKEGFEGPIRDQQKLQAEIDQTKAKYEGLEAEARDAGKAYDAAVVNSTYRQYSDEAVEARANIAALKNEVSSKGWLAESAGTLRTMGYGLYSTLTPAILMAGRAAIRSAQDVDSAYRDMRKTVNGTEEQFEHLRDAALEYGRTHVTSADQILEIESVGGQLGITADNLESFAKTVSNLDIATNMDTEDIALDLAKLSNILHFGREEYDNFADALVRLGNNEPALESDIMQISTRFAGMASIVGMSADQVLAWSTAATATGQKAEAAGSSMQRFISNVETSVTKGGDKLDEWVRVAGMSAEEFAAKFKTDASGALYDFIAGLGRMQKSGESVNQELAELGISNVRDKQLIEGLAQQMANGSESANILRDSLQMSSDAYHGLSTTMADGSIEQAGDAAREANKKAEGFSGQLQMMSNTAQELGVQLADGAIPYVNIFTTALQGLSGAVSDMPGAVKAGIVGVGGFTALLGPGLIAVGALTDGWNRLNESFAGLKAHNLERVMQLDIGGYGTKLDRVSRSLEKVRHEQARFSQEFGYESTRLAAHQKELEKTQRSYESLGSKMATLKTIGKVAGGVAAGMLAFAAIDKIVEVTDDYIQHSNDVNAASKAMFDRMASAAGFAATSVEGSAKRMKSALSGSEIWDQQKNWTKGLAESLGQLQEKANSAFTNDSLVKGYADNIKSLMTWADEFGKLNPKQQAELASEVENFNRATGASLEVIDAETGKLKDQETQAILTRDAFAKLADQKRINAMKDYFAEEEATNSKAVIEAEKRYAEAQAGLRDIESKIAAVSDAPWDEDTASTITALNTQAQGYRDTLAELDRQLPNLRNSLDASRESQVLYNKAASDGATAIDMMLTSVGEGTDITATLQANSQSVMDFVDVLDSIGGSALNLGHDQVMELAQTWDGSLSSIMEKLREYNVSLDGLEKKQIGDKSFYVTDNGTVFTEEGKLEEIRSFNIGELHYFVTSDGTVLDELNNATDLKAVDIGTKRYLVSSDGSVQNETGACENLRALEIDGKHYMVSDDGTVWDEQRKLGQLNDAEIANKYVHIEDRNSAEVDQAVKTIQSDINILSSTEGHVTINSNIERVKDEIWNVDYALNAINGHSSTVDIFINRHYSSEGQASGGINSTPLYQIPAYATGGALNGIVTKATLTNQGWVGEAGYEALVRMGHRTAVVPLSNRRYVRPFARAVASEMGSGQTVVNNYYTVDGVSYAEGTDGAKAVKQLVKTTVVSRRRGAKR